MRGSVATRLLLLWCRLSTGCLLLAHPLDGVALSSCAIFENDYLRISATGQSTPNQPNDTTWTVTAESKSDAQMQGFDFFGTQEQPLGFFGPMGHVNPHGQSTIFSDYNASFEDVGADDLQDSQFLFHSDNLLITPDSASESHMHLRADFVTADAVGTNIAFAQIVIANTDGEMVEFDGRIGFKAGSGIPVQRVTGLVGVAGERLPGDYNLDETVDPADYGVWRDNFGASGSGQQLFRGDGNADGLVDARDYIVWRDNLGSTLSGTSASGLATGMKVPELSSLALVTMLFLVISNRRECLTQSSRG